MTYYLRRVMVAALVVVLVAALAGCGAGEKQSPAPSPADKPPAAAAGPAETAGAGEGPEDNRPNPAEEGKAAETKEGGGNIIFSDNPVFTGTKQVMEEIVKELDELLKILDSLEDLSGDDLNF